MNQHTSKSSRPLLRTVLLVVALAALLGACGSDSKKAAVGTKENPGPAPHGLYIQRGVNALANISQLGVIGTIVEIGEPVSVSYPNPHDATMKATYSKRTFRDVRVKVERVVFTSQGVTAAVGDTITVTIEPQGESVRTASGCTVSGSESVGPLAVGEKRLFLLRQHTNIPTAEGGTRTVLALTSGWQAHWRIEGDMANSICEARSVPLPALLNRINAERSNGRDPARDPGTEENPIAPARP